MNKQIKYDKVWNEKNPWMKHYYSAKSRCENNKNISYRWYGEKNIKFNLTKNNIKFIWNRDNAKMLIKPSLDRKNSCKNYNINNCRFIELDKNCGAKRILQLNGSGELITEYKSAAEAARAIGKNHHNICVVARGNSKRITAFGYRWKFQERR